MSRAASTDGDDGTIISIFFVGAKFSHVKSLVYSKSLKIIFIEANSVSFCALVSPFYTHDRRQGRKMRG